MLDADAAAGGQRGDGDQACYALRRLKHSGIEIYRPEGSEMVSEESARPR
ncbi:hypothetical protein GALL_280570 [mine drainage metagenome]|uniref:Uncharacterized protein n=1 Tax=mine drainage metagenome TaxID=410659 RepID=A0A1J5R3N3_9ZZZZ